MIYSAKASAMDQAENDAAGDADARQFDGESVSACGVCGLSNSDVVQLMDDPSSSTTAWRLSLLVRNQTLSPAVI